MTDDILTTGELLKGRKNGSSPETPKGFKNINWDARKNRKNTMSVPGFQNPLAEEVQSLKQEKQKIESEVLFLREENEKKAKEFNDLKKKFESLEQNLQTVRGKEEENQVQKQKFEEERKEIQEVLEEAKKKAEQYKKEAEEKKEELQEEVHRLKNEIVKKEQDEKHVKEELELCKFNFDAMQQNWRTEVEKGKKAKKIWAFLGILVGVLGGVIWESMAHISTIFM